MARGRDKLMNGFLLGLAFGILLYYGLPSVPFVGEFIGGAISGLMDTLGEAILTAVSDSTTFLKYAGVLISGLIGGIIGMIVDIR